MPVDSVLRGACRLGTAMAPFALAALAAVLTTGPAHAELEICNNMHKSLSIAIGYKSGDDWVSEGWWNIDPRDCKTVVGSDLTNRYYYYHADGVVFGDDDYAFCTRTEPFTIVGDKNCADRGYEKDYFTVVDTGKEATSFTLTLHEEIDENTPIGRKISPMPSSANGDIFDQVGDMLIGWWSGSEEEAGAQIGFIDQTNMHYTYEGEVVNKFDYRLASSCPDGSGDDDVHLVIVDYETGEQTCYGIYELDFNTLVLRFIEEGRMLHYSRVE